MDKDIIVRALFAAGFEPAQGEVSKMLNEIDSLRAALAEAEAHLRAVLDVKGVSYCPWCHSWLKEGHKPDCPRQAAAKWLEEHEKEQDG